MYIDSESESSGQKGRKTLIFFPYLTSFENWNQWFS